MKLQDDTEYEKTAEIIDDIWVLLEHVCQSDPNYYLSPSDKQRLNKIKEKIRVLEARAIYANYKD